MSVKKIIFCELCSFFFQINRERERLYFRTIFGVGQQNVENQNSGKDVFDRRSKIEKLKLEKNIFQL